MFPVPKELRTITQYNTGTSLLRLSTELRNTMFQVVLGHYAIHIYAKPGIETREHPCGYPWTHNELALLRESRQIYAETALLPYSVNVFAFVCRVDWDRWVSRRTFG
jgi:hypothetical protein